MSFQALKDGHFLGGRHQWSISFFQRGLLCGRAWACRPLGPVGTEEEPSVGADVGSVCLGPEAKPKWVAGICTCCSFCPGAPLQPAVWQMPLALPTPPVPATLALTAPLCSPLLLWAHPQSCSFTRLSPITWSAWPGRQPSLCCFPSLEL